MPKYGELGFNSKRRRSKPLHPEIFLFPKRLREFARIGNLCISFSFDNVNLLKKWQQITNATFKQKWNVYNVSLTNHRVKKSNR